MGKKLIALLVTVPLVLGGSAGAFAADATKPAKAHSQSVKADAKPMGKKGLAKHAAKKAANQAAKKAAKVATK